MKKKTIRCIILSMLLTLMFSMAAYGAEIQGAAAIAPGESQTVTKAEQVRWCYRIKNGVKQKRLWSVTYGRWKTDWINI